MYISEKDRETIRQKFEGKCAYSGTDLEPDWQPDHLKPVVRNWWTNTAMFEENHNLNNIIPAQRLINHYKGSLSLEDFRTWYLGGLHLRLKKVPKNPRTEKGARRKAYILQIAAYFGITEDTPFSGKFYFETFKS